MPTPTAKPLYRVRRSLIHGTGVFATRRIARGKRILEYTGERVSHAEADRRYAHKAHDDNHTFLFTLSSRVVIDGGSDGNEARWINHSCDPNCESVIDGGRVYIEALRTLQPGEELSYDYMIERDAGDPPDIDTIFACRCKAAHCRGTMLLPPRQKKPRRRAKERAAGGKPRAKDAAKSPAKGRAKTRAVTRSGGATRVKSQTRVRATTRSARRSRANGLRQRA
jgi:hypothetical protein